MLSQLTDVTSDPLDMVLFGVGLRLLQLSKTGDSKFTQLLDNRNFTIQLGSEAENIARHYVINNGAFSQYAGKATEPTLTITFKDSMTGVKLLTKGDATAFMVGIQNGDVKMAGDYALLMWFNQVAKFIVPKVPEKFQPIVEQAKPLLEKATPIAKDLFAKATTLFANVAENINEKSNQSKQFYTENSQQLKDVATNTLEDIKDTANTIKNDITEKVAEIKEETQETFNEIKEKIEEKQEIVENWDTQDVSPDVKQLDEQFNDDKLETNKTTTAHANSSQS